jgi:hypothetical protein
MPTCTDFMKNGQETGVDCGGPICSKCAPGEGCNDNNDCESFVCVASICQAPSCIDTIKNGDEADVDCGGSCPTQCAPGQKCNYGTDCTTGSCNGICICPLGMTVATTMGGGSYCIDSGEVTYAQYDLFVLGNPPIQPGYCSWNTTYIPIQGWPYTPMAAQLPVAHVDWCDAYAYCKSVSKHLCGSIGGGPIAVADYSNHLTDGWYNACTAQNTNMFPYGNTYDPAKCNGNSSPGVTKPKQLTCLGGFSGLYDMSGNVKEWEDSCDVYSGDSDACRVRGGSYTSPEAGLRCDADETFPRNTASPEIGIRCCI